jgi:hypothetical protein
MADTNELPDDQEGFEDEGFEDDEAPAPSPASPTAGDSRDADAREASATDPDASGTNAPDAGVSPKAESAPAVPPQEGTAASLEEVSNMPETLHTAARAGSIESVEMLLRSKADPTALDNDGKTAEQLAQAVGKHDVVALLRQAQGLSPKAAAPEVPDKPAEAPPADEGPSPKADAEPSPKAAAPAQESMEATLPPAKDSLDAAMEDAEKQDGDATGQFNPSASQGNKSTTNTRVGDPQDLKERTAFSKSTVEGVMKGTIFLHSMSTYRSSPEITIGTRGNSVFIRAGQGPAPGSYNLPDEEKSKYKAASRYSFGGSSRFGLGQSPTKIQPGPGQYNPKDPSLFVDAKVGFGTSVRGKMNSAAQANPGPGAYESKNNMGGGLMFTARGRHPTSYMRSRSMPGPGAYTPATQGVYNASPKCGFGTSIRGDFTGGASRGMPGPGTYEMQNWQCMGRDSAKYSATSRRRMHDLNSYVTPGPGTYNAHGTAFGPWKFRVVAHPNMASYKDPCITHA